MTTNIYDHPSIRLSCQKSKSYDRLEKFFFYTLLLLGTLLILVKLGSLIAEERYWWIKVLDFPRIQVLILTLVVLVSFFFTNRGWGVWQYTFVVCLVATVGLQAIYLFPYTKMAAEKVETVAVEAADPQATVSVMVANVKMSNRRYEKLLAIVNDVDPDIGLSIETNQWWENVLQPLDGMILR